MSNVIPYGHSNGFTYRDYYDAAKAGYAFGRKHGPRIKKLYNNVKESLNKPPFFYPPSKNNSNTMPKRSSTRVMQPAVRPGAIRSSGGLVIGSKRGRSSFRESVLNALYPPVSFNSKWNFQMDCHSGRVSAISIPILTRPLRQPMIAQLNNALTTDNGSTFPDPTINTGVLGHLSNRVVIKNYVSNLRFYNSSEQVARCRLVWYKPRVDIQEFLNLNAVGDIPPDPINLTMYASTLMTPPTVGLAVPAVAGDGLTFTSSNTPAGTGWYINYNHAGNAVVYSATASTFLASTNTVGNNAINNVAQLDPTLTPSSGQVRMFTSQYYNVLKTENFTIAPGNQFNTKLSIKNRAIMGSTLVDLENFYYKDSTVIGVLYVMGQMVFTESDSNNTISTGSAQISVLREDNCTMGLIRKKAKFRLNLTNPYVNMGIAEQSIINVQTDAVDNTAAQDA